MAESEDIKEIINQVGIQAVTAVMMALRDMDVGLRPIPTASLRWPQRQWHS